MWRLAPHRAYSGDGLRDENPMSNHLDATAKDAEGKLEAAYGELTGDTGHQIKGKAKQVQASGMHALEDVKQSAKDSAETISDAAGRLADKAK